jgi:hypothetical protein
MSNKRHKAEDEVLAGAKNLDPNDNSPRAQQIRETAEDIQDHRESNSSRYGLDSN